MPDDTLTQIADVIVAEHDDPASGLLWTSRTLTAYPGCCAVVSVDVARRWVLVRVRR